MIDIELLKKICEIPGAPGFEQEIRSFLLTQLSGLSYEINTDSMGNVIAFRKGRSDQKLMVAAHMDEISYIVSHIDDEGFIRFQALGGFDPKTLTAQRVHIHGEKIIPGVMASKPVHIMSPEEKRKSPDIKDFFIDTGLSKEELIKNIGPGAPVTRERTLIEMGDCVNSKSLDNRVSVFILLECLKSMDKSDFPMDFYGVFTVQEEMGLRGATVATSSIQPDFGIALDTTIAYDLPGAQAHEVVTKLGKGPAIKIMDSMVISDYRMVNYMKGIATSNNIPYQLEILQGGGTDTAALQRSGKGGSISGCISIPTRHLHQVIEMSHKSDIVNGIALLKHCILNMTEFDWQFK
jgi:tetrahedral aminopeptidase